MLTNTTRQNFIIKLTHHLKCQFCKVQSCIITEKTGDISVDHVSCTHHSLVRESHPFTEHPPHLMVSMRFKNCSGWDGQHTTFYIPIQSTVSLRTPLLFFFILEPSSSLHKVKCMAIIHENEKWNFETWHGKNALHIVSFIILFLLSLYMHIFIMEKC